MAERQAGQMLTGFPGLLLRATIRQLRDDARDTLMPRRCVFCDVFCEANEKAVCAACSADLPWIRHGCLLCGIPIPPSVSVCCASCQSEPPPFAATVVPLSYLFPVDAAIKAFKFHRKLYFAAAFVELLLPHIHRLPHDIDALLPVPLHRWRHMKRGYNQASEIARPLASAMGVPVVANVFRSQATPYQSGLGEKERRQNLKSAFSVRGAIGRDHVLIVDDVITSGETTRQLARVLRRAGVAEVSVLAIARA